MKLLKLSLRNVASYEKAEINFEDLTYPVFVSGRCGSGKTTLFVDAITSALYGYAYGTQRLNGVPAYKVLMAVDKPKAEISLEFEVEGKRYKVIRSVRKLGVSEVKLYEYDNKLGDWRIVRVREVDKEILKLIGMPAEGLLNSAIVRQGEVVNFIKLKPAERRNILQEILNIRFEHLREKIREIKFSIEKRLESINAQISSIERELSEKKQLLSELSKLKEKEIPTLKFKVNELKKIKDKLKLDIEKVNEKIKIVETELKRLDNISKELENKEAKLNELIKKENELKKHIERYGESKIKEAPLINELIIRIYELDKHIEKKKNELEKIEKELSKLKRYEELNKDLQKLSNVEAELENLNKIRNNLIQEKAYITSKIKEIENNLNLLQSAKVKCPVCGALLTHDAKIKRREHLLNEVKKLNSELRINALKIAEVESKVKSLETLLSKKRVLEAEIRSLERDITNLEISEEDVNRLKEEVEALIKEHRSLLSKVLSFTNTFSLDYARKVINEMMSIKEDIGKINQLKARISELKEEIKNYIKELERKESYVQELKSLNEVKNSLSNKLQEVEQGLEIYQNQLSRVEERISMIKERLKKLEKSEIELENLKEEREKLKFDLNVHNYLYEIFAEGKFPAKLLSKFIRVIEDYANDYLRMFNTDIRIELKLKQSLRGRGSVTQIVELIAYSNNYRREIETFSGGEQTLIGFAIRLAISKLIAELYAYRKRPKFLIIDEGFGPLDNELRDTVAYALSKLYESGEYEQLIIISHQDDLKEHPVFRTLIEVEKVSGKSKIRVQKQT